MKKIFFLFALTFLSLGCLTSCKNNISYDDLDSVTYKEILNLSHASYIVVAYQAQCPNCDDLKTVIAEYVKYVKKHKDAMPIYAINVNLKINKDMVISKDESYPSNMASATTYSKIKVKATPCIILVENGKVSKIISDYNTMRPVTDGKTFFKDLMK